jgi:hypothetical protein
MMSISRSIEVASAAVNSRRSSLSILNQRSRAGPQMTGWPEQRYTYTRGCAPPEVSPIDPACSELARCFQFPKTVQSQMKVMLSCSEF